MREEIGVMDLVAIVKEADLYAGLWKSAKEDFEARGEKFTDKTNPWDVAIAIEIARLKNPSTIILPSHVSNKTFQDSVYIHEISELRWHIIKYAAENGYNILTDSRTRENIRSRYKVKEKNPESVLISPKEINEKNYSN